MNCFLPTTSSIASPIFQEGQSERNFPIFAFSSWFFLFFPEFFLIFSWFFLIFGNFFAVRSGTLPPLPPQWLRHCPQLHRFRWLTPHFEGNHNIFLSDTILLKTKEFIIFMNTPTVVLLCLDYTQTLGTNVASLLWLHWSPVLLYVYFSI